MSEPIERQVTLWREHMASRPGVTADEVDELEDHLRGHMEQLSGAGLSADEAFLVAVKRLGSQHEIAREFARENSQRLWKQLVLDGSEGPARAPGDRGGWWPAVVFAALAAIVVKVPAAFGLSLDTSVEFYARNASLLGFAGIAAYLLWRHRASKRYVAAVALGFAVLAVAANLYPSSTADVLAMTALHVPIAAWVVVGLAYATSRWRHAQGRMDFLRFSGEFTIYMVLIATAGSVLVALIGAITNLAGYNPETFLREWLIPCGAAGAVVIATWLVEAKQAVVENMAPVLARTFTPLFTLAFVGLIGVVIASGNVADLDRGLLIACDAVLVVAVGLILYNLTARSAAARPGWFDWLQLTLAASALLLNAIALANIVARITDGWTFNRAVVVGGNLILLVNLVVSAWLLVRVVRERAGAVPALERWQTAFIPAYAAWALVVVLVLPPLFGLT